ncbi:MAG: MATE family efflux transporter [Clostridia bacterium]
MQADDNLIKKTFNRYKVPTMLSVLGGTINVFFDSIIVGQKFPIDGLAAVNLCMPINLILCTIGALVAFGSSIISSRKIGKGDYNLSQKYYNTSIALLIVLSALIMVLGSIFITPLSHFLAGAGGNFQMVYDYAKVTLLGALPKLLIYVPFCYLRLEGKNKQLSFVMLLMMVINIVLDYLFLFVFNMGLMGAAVASVIATTIAMVVGFIFLSTKNSNFKAKFSFVKYYEVIYIIRMGSPNALNNLLSAIRVLLLNILCLKYGGAMAVSIFAVVNSISEISLCIINGIPQTANPIIGIFDTEKNNVGIRILMKMQFKTGVILSIAFGILITVFSGAIGTIFKVSEPLMVPMLCFAVSVPIALVNSVMTYFYNCSKKIRLANAIIALRIVIFPVTFAVLFYYLNSMFWLFLPLGELMTFLSLLAIVHFLSKGKENISKLLLLDETLDKSGKTLEFSVKSNDKDICDASEKITDFCAENLLTKKQILKISLAIEEIMVAITKISFNNEENHSFDVRAFAINERIGIGIRYSAKESNLIELSNKDEYKDELMGVTMIKNMAKSVEYSRFFGINSILILL